MRKPTIEQVFAAPRPICAWNGPKLTLAQVGAILGNTRTSVITDAAEFLRDLNCINAVESVEAKPAAPAKPVYGKVTRKVRVKDLEVGCVIRFINTGPTWDWFVKRGMLTPGKEYTITSAGRFGFSFPYDTVADTGVKGGTWSGGGLALPFDFVSNPNYVQGFRIGETVYSTGGPCGKWGSMTGFGPYKVRGAGPRGYEGHVQVDNGGTYPKEYLTRDETKSAGYKPPVATYKVRDGEVQEGGAMWWLCSHGPRVATMSPGSGDYSNCKTYPQAYQLAEPEFDMVRVPGSYGAVKAYRYMQAPYNGDSKAYYAATEKQAIPEPKKRWAFNEAKVVEDRTKWAVGDILRVIHGDRFEHQGKDYFIDGEDYIIVSLYKDNGVSDVRVRAYNANRHDARIKSGSRLQFKLQRKADLKRDGWLLAKA